MNNRRCRVRLGWNLDDSILLGPFGPHLVQRTPCERCHACSISREGSESTGSGVVVNRSVGVSYDGGWADMCCQAVESGTGSLGVGGCFSFFHEEPERFVGGGTAQGGGG